MPSNFKIGDKVHRMYDADLWTGTIVKKDAYGIYASIESMARPGIVHPKWFIDDQWQIYEPVHEPAIEVEL